MCEPIAAGLMIGGTLLSGGLQAYGALQEGDAAMRTARQNARLARIAAGDALREGGREAAQVRMEASQIIGEQKAAFGASGIDPTSGSPLALMADTRMMSEIDAQTLITNSRRRAWELQTQGKDMLSQGRAAKSRSRFAAAGALLGAVGQSAGMAYDNFPQIFRAKEG